MSTARRKRKARQQATAYRLPDAAPTPEQFNRAAWEQVEAPRIVGHDHGNVRTYRRRSRALEWAGAGWIDDEKAAALIRWEALRASASAKSPRSAMDMSPRGFGSGEPSQRQIEASQRLRIVEAELRRDAGGYAMGLVRYWLESEEYAMAMYRDAFGCNTAENYQRAQSMVRRVAVCLERVLRRA